MQRMTMSFITTWHSDDVRAGLAPAVRSHRRAVRADTRSAPYVRRSGIRGGRGTSPRATGVEGVSGGQAFPESVEGGGQAPALRVWRVSRGQAEGGGQAPALRVWRV